MFLRRIQVPDFRVLKDVDITFEPEFSPHIFPLGSLNGGGKSTLLQLIFILLSCSGDPEKHIFIQNMLDGFEIELQETNKLLATLYLTNNDRDIKLQFYVYTNEILIEPKNINEDIENFIKETIRFSAFAKRESLKSELSILEQQILYLKSKHQNIKIIKTIKEDRERNKLLKKEIDNLKYGVIDNFIRNLLKNKKYSDDIEILSSDLHFIEAQIEIRIQEQTLYLEKIKLEQTEIEKEIKQMLNYLKNKQLRYICNYINNENNENSQQEYALLCSVDSLDISEIENLFEQLASKLFLAAPFTQVFLFLPKDSTKLLFKEHNYKTNYYSTLEETKIKLLNLFTYDILSVDYIIEFFKAARDKDFKQAIETGEYGNYYQNILKELNSVLGDKKINIDSDLSGVNFKIDRYGKMHELYPEDLSHGELKRLSIYVWLKYKKIENSIVLMDEIENAFHPDWQYKIISDLTEWGASNQYILATHSYELCQALTPAHVKELEPKLLAEKQVEN